MSFPRPLVALIVGQIGLHSAMAGVRVTAPLHALQQGYSAWAVGVLMALFAAAPVLLALPAGRLADRRGYHRPMSIAVACTAAGATVSLVATWFAGNVHFTLLCIGAALSGAGANVGLIAILRTAGRSAADSVERVRTFSWLGLAPALSNVIGPVSAGLLIDGVGYRAAFGFMALLPLVSLVLARRVPREVPPAMPAARRTVWDLWRLPGMARLLFVNGLLTACWDVHTFAVPILGHQREFSASTIGFVLGAFSLSVSGVRLVIPLVAHRMEAVTVLTTSMLVSAAVLAVYPVIASPWLMGMCAVVLGVALGSVQPMIMSTLHHLAPEHRHGEAIALRSMTLNASSTLMPLVFGLAGNVFGVGALFWLMAAAVGSGSAAVKRLAFRT